MPLFIINVLFLVISTITEYYPDCKNALSFTNQLNQSLKDLWNRKKLKAQNVEKEHAAFVKAWNEFASLPFRPEIETKPSPVMLDKHVIVTSQLRSKKDPFYNPSPYVPRSSAYNTNNDEYLYVSINEAPTQPRSLPRLVAHCQLPAPDAEMLRQGNKEYKQDLICHAYISLENTIIFNNEFKKHDDWRSHFGCELSALISQGRKVLSQVYGISPASIDAWYQNTPSTEKSTVIKLSRFHVYDQVKAIVKPSVSSIV